MRRLTEQTEPGWRHGRNTQAIADPVAHAERIAALAEVHSRAIYGEPIFPRCLKGKRAWVSRRYGKVWTVVMDDLTRHRITRDGRRLIR